MNKKILLNSVSGILLYITNVFVAFIMSPVIVRALGNQAYGAWEITLGLTGYLGLLDLGASPAIISLVARAQATDNWEKISEVLRTSVLILLLAGVASFVCLLAVGPVSSSLFNTAPGEVSHLRLVLAMMGLNLLLQFPGTAFVAFLMGLQQYWVVNGVRAFTAIGTAVFTIGALSHTGADPLPSLAAITVVSNFLQYTVLTAFAITRYPHAMSVGLGSRKVLREILSFGTGSMLLMAADRIQRQSVPLLIAQFNSLGSVVFFTIPNRLVDYAKNLGLAAGTPLAPVYGHLHAKGDLSAQQKAWFALTLPMQFVVLGSALMVLGLGRPFVSLWMGPSFAENGRWVLVFLGLSLMMEGISPNSGRYLVGTGRHRFPAIFLFVWSLFALVPILIGARAAGVSGAALGAAFANVVSSAVTWLAACRALGIRSKVHLHRTFSCWLPPVLITCLTLAAMRYVCGVSDYGRLALCAIVGILAYTLSSWTFAFDRTERIECTMKLRRALSGMLTAWQGQ